jgi:hypothetical protein
VKTRVLELAVIYRCTCGKVNRGSISVYKGQEAKQQFMRQFIFQPADEIAQASEVVSRAVSDLERTLATAAATRIARLDRHEQLGQEVLQALPPQAADEARHEAILNAHLCMEPDWDKLRVISTPIVACFCDITVPKLKAGATEQVYTCHCPECEQINDWHQRPDSPVPCYSCGEHFRLDYTLLWPGGINGEEERRPLVGRNGAHPQGV